MDHVRTEQPEGTPDYRVTKERGFISFWQELLDALKGELLPTNKPLKK
jgi:hypothetical protein